MKKYITGFIIRYIATLLIGFVINIFLRLDMFMVVYPIVSIPLCLIGEALMPMFKEGK